MFTVYARHKRNHQRTETQCASLDEALLHLRELITNEINDPEGPLYWEYGISFDPAIAAGRRPPEYHFPDLFARQTALVRSKSKRKGCVAVDTSTPEHN